MRRVVPALAVAVALLAGGCARAGAGGGGSDTPGFYDGGPGLAQEYPTLAPDALQKWRDFPAGARPRPIVLLSGPVTNPGYATGDAKLRALTSGYTLPATLPPAPPATVAVSLPDGPATLPTVDVRAAFATLQHDAVPQPQPGATVAPLPIVSVVLGTASYRTDRGPVDLPSWLFTAQDGLGPMAVPALAPSAFWRYGELFPGSPSQPATVSADGRTVHLSVYTGLGCDGSPPPLSTAVTETPGAVGVSAQAHFPPAPPDCAVPAIAVAVDVTVTLAAPLGGRVLVTGDGAPVEVHEG